MNKVINKEILRLAIPNIITGLTIPLLGMADFALMGRMDDQAYINAIGIGTNLFDTIYWSMVFLRMGTTGLAAQAYGAKDIRMVSYTLYRGLTISTLIAVIFIIFHQWLIQAFLPLFQATIYEKELTAAYFNIRIWAAPAALGLYVTYGWFLAVKKAIPIMWVAIGINLLNIGLNFWLVLGLKMGIEGIAIATAISTWSGFLCSLAIIAFSLRHLLAPFKNDVLRNLGEMKRFLQVNSDIFIRALCLTGTFTFFTAVSGYFGQERMAANLLLLQFMHLLSYGVDGFAYAAESLVGNYYGARDKTSFRLTIRWSFLWGLVIGGVFTVAFYFFGQSILGILTDKTAVISAAMPFIIWVIAMTIVNTAAFIWDGVYTGMTATKPMRNTMIIATLLIFLPTYYLLKDNMGNHALWLAMTLFMLTRGIALSLLAPKAIFGWLRS